MRVCIMFKSMQDDFAIVTGFLAFANTVSQIPKKSASLNLEKQRLKRQCHKIFCFWFFTWISYPPAPEYSIRTVSNFFKNLWRYSQVKVHHRYQRHCWQICHRCQWHRRQNLPPVLLVLLIPVPNLPPVSTIPAANLTYRYIFAFKFTLRSQQPDIVPIICHQYQQH